MEGSAPLHRVATVLETVAVSHNGLTLSEITSQTGFPKGTVHRIVQNLLKVGYLSGEGGRTVYILGPRFARTVQFSIAPASLSSLFLPILQSLVDQFGEAAFAARVTGLGAELAASLMPQHNGRAHVNPGSRFPINAAATAKSIFAFQNEGVIEQALAAPLVKYTTKTQTDKNKVRAHLAEVRKQGYSVSDEELDPGVLCFACPVQVGRIGVLYSIAIVGLKQPFLERHPKSEVIASLKAAARRVSHVLQTNISRQF